MRGFARYISDMFVTVDVHVAYSAIVGWLRYSQFSCFATGIFAFNFCCFTIGFVSSLLYRHWHNYNYEPPTSPSASANVIRGSGVEPTVTPAPWDPGEDAGVTSLCFGLPIRIYETGSTSELA